MWDHQLGSDRQRNGAQKKVTVGFVNLDTPRRVAKIPFGECIKRIAIHYLVGCHYLASCLPRRNAMLGHGKPMAENGSPAAIARIFVAREDLCQHGWGLAGINWCQDGRFRRKRSRFSICRKPSGRARTSRWREPQYAFWFWRKVPPWSTQDKLAGIADLGGQPVESRTPIQKRKRCPRKEHQHRQGDFKRSVHYSSRYCFTNCKYGSRRLMGSHRLIETSGSTGGLFEVKHDAAAHYRQGWLGSCRVWR